MGWLRISFPDTGGHGSYWGNVACQALRIWIKKSSLFYFCRMFVTSWPKDLFSSKKGHFLIKFRIKFNWYNMRFFQRAWAGFNSLWIHFIFREFNCVSEIPNRVIQMEIWARYLGSRTFWFTIILLPLSSRYGFLANLQLFCTIRSYRE